MSNIRSNLTLHGVLCGLLLFGFAIGSSSSNSNDLRIVGGFPALQNSTMHQVSVRRKSNDLNSFGSGHICGGSLITSVKVVTAAHCLVDQNDRKRAASYFRVVGGNLNRLKNDASTVVRDVSKVVIHERYNPRTFANDVGVMILSDPVSSTHSTLRTIAMVTVQPIPTVVCQTSGWGTTKFELPYAEVMLLAVNVTVQRIEACNATTSYNGSMLPGMICVGQFEGMRDTCQGDSGGPLVCNGQLAGIVSHGNGCAQIGYPGVYADVAYYRRWIETNSATRSSAISLVIFVILLTNALRF